MTQLLLPFPEQPDYAAADFLQAASNADALAWLRNAASWPGGRLVIWGEEGCGKTHLLSVWAAMSGGSLQAGSALRGLPERAGGGGLAIDDADRPAEEAGLLHLLNAAQEATVPVLMAARQPPARWVLRLPDLASRVRGAAAVRILPPDDDLLRALLARLLSARQIAVTEEVQAWLLRRLPRTPAAVREAAAALDREALTEGRAVTRAIAAQVLARIESQFVRQTYELCAVPGRPVSPYHDKLG